MLTAYRRVLGLPGAWAFSMSGLVARLPISMVSLGIVLLVSTRTGSYGLAGAVSAAYLVANAAFAVVQARLVDRLGQSRVLPGAIVLFTVALALLMIAVERGWPTPVPHLLAAIAGAALPPVGSCVRARWSRIVTDKPQLQTAFAVEAVADEAVFVLGPTLVTLLATGLHPLAGLVTAIVAGLAGTLALAAQRRTEPPAGGRRRGTSAEEPQPTMGWAVLAPLVVASFGLGALFGATEVSTVAFAEELGAKGASGPLLACWALGSLVSGVVTGAITRRVSNAARFRRGISALTLLMTPLPFVESLFVMGALLFVAGFAIAPTLIAAVAWVEETVPAARLTEGIAVVTTGLGAGVAPGAAVTGVVIDRAGASASYWVAAGAGLLGVAVAFSMLLTGTDRANPREPSPSGSRG